MNDKVFPLNTRTYPITRNIRVELAVTVIVALLGIIFQLRLWKTIRQRRRDGAKAREEKKRKREDTEIEVGRQLEETNARERMEWEARYGGNSHSQHLEEVKSMSVQELPVKEGEGDDGKAVDLAAIKGVEGAEECQSIVVSERSYRCEDCKARESNGEVAYVIPDDKHLQNHNEEEPEPTPDQVSENETQFPLFNGAAAARMDEDDNQSAASAVVGSETGTMRSKRCSGMSFGRRGSVQGSLGFSSQSQEGIVRTGCDDADLASNSSAEGVADESSLLDFRRSSMVSTAEGEHVKKTEDIDDAKSEPEEHYGKTHVIGDTAEQECAEHKAEDMQDQCKKQKLDKNLEFDHDAEKPEQGFLENAEQKSGSPAENKEMETAVGEQVQEQLSEPQPDEQGHPTVPVLYEGHSGSNLESPQETEQRLSEGNASKSISVASDQDAEKTAELHQKLNVHASKSPDSEPSQAAHHDGKPRTNNPSTKSKSKYSYIEYNSPPKAKAEASSKKEKPTLNKDTVKDLPQRTSRIVQSYRTNEWAKHLDDAMIPGPPPIQPIEEEEPEIPIDTSGKEAAAPVKVQELLQTPLNARLPPAVERKERRSSSESHRRESYESQPRQTDVLYPTPKGKQSLDIKLNAKPRPWPHTAQPSPPKEHDNEPKTPKWKGPPSLLAMREDLVRNRLSSTSSPADPWLASRNNPRHSIFSTSSLSPTQTIPEEAEDDVPLSQRRAMLQQQQQTQSSMQSPQVTSVPPSLPSPKPGQKDSNHSNNAHMVMDAWRNSIREDLRRGRDPLGTRGLGGNSAIPAERTSSSFAFGQSPRDRLSAMNLHIENAIAEGMQKGDMNDLHRQAMRRLQASATRKTE